MLLKEGFRLASQAIVHKAGLHEHPLIQLLAGLKALALFGSAARLRSRDICPIMWMSLTKTFELLLDVGNSLQQLGDDLVTHRPFFTQFGVASDELV